MDPRITTDFATEEQSDFHKELLKHCRTLVDYSRSKMSDHYDKWDEYDDIYNGIMPKDRADDNAEKRKEPQKMVVPVVFAQIQTFIAFLTSVFNQRTSFYELEGFGPDDWQPAKVGEALLDRDLIANDFPRRSYQALLDISKFGLGVMKEGWVHETEELEQPVEAQPTVVAGTVVAGVPGTAKAKVTRYLGNRIYNVSPYRFFPDVRLPLGRFQEGEFCASEDTISMTQLYRLQEDGAVAGIEHVRLMTKKDFGDRKGSRIPEVTTEDMLRGKTLSDSGGGTVILTECQVSLIPSKFKVNGEPMGTSTKPEKWNIWYVNDQRIVKAEPLNYNHNKYTYSVAQLLPDEHHRINPGWAETTNSLQSVLTWFINSHVTSVRKVIQNRLLVDPEGVYMEDIRERRPVIRLRPTASRAGVERFVKQLEVQDVTQNHLKDAQFINDLIQLTTGINDNALGQYFTGRRSATESRNVNNAAASRLLVYAKLIWIDLFRPLGEKMLSNHRQGLDETTFVKVFGETADPTRFSEFKKVTKEDLLGDYDFKIFEGTSPSERLSQAATLSELLSTLLQNPEAIAPLGYDPRLLADEIMELRGIRNPERFKIQRQIPLNNPEGANAGNVAGDGTNGAPQGVARSNGAPGVPLFEGLVAGGGRQA